MRDDWSTGPLRKVPEFELSEATKQHIENMVTLAMTQVVATVSAAMQNKIIEAASKQAESPPTP